MIRFCLTRLALGLLSLLAIYTLTFVVVVHTPGNPFQVSERQMPREVIHALEARYDLDRPVHFYFQYLARALTDWDLGPSFQYREWTVNQILSEAAPVSLTIGSLAIIIAVMVGVPVGVCSAVRPGSWVSFGALVLTLLGISVPAFVTATILLSVFSVWLNWAPVGGWGEIQHLVLPSVSLSLPFMAYITRLTRSSMLEALDSDYIRAARARGLHERCVIWKHALKNAFLPVLSYLGPACAQALTGSFVVETVFNVPGMGTYFVQSVQNLDRGLIMAVVLLFSSLVILFNLAVDLLYAVVDPRVRVTR